MLAVDRLSAWRGRTRVLFEMTFAVDKGETLALVGANGAGKTSTMAAVMGSVRSRGEVRLGDQRVDGWSTVRRARAGVSLVPEGRGLFPKMSVYENLVVGLKRREVGRLGDVLAVFPRIESKLTRSMTDLSGGEQQMVAIGRSLLRLPEVLLLDEPCLGLAPGVIADVYEVLDGLKRKGMTMLIAESSIPRAREIADKLCLVKAGRCDMIVQANDADACAELEAAAFGGTTTTPHASPR
jgi:branched-chain amino acid transport system ATP-binding protein